jgi:hypothetical protein
VHRLLSLILVGCAPDAVNPQSESTEPTIDVPSDDEDHNDDTGDTDLVDIDYDEACNPLATGDDCLLPFPSMHLMDDDGGSPTGLRLNIAHEDYFSPDGDLPLDPAMFNFADGFSPVTPILVNLGRDVDPAFLSGWGEQEDTVAPGAPIALIHAQTGVAIPILTEMDQLGRGTEAYDDRHALIIRPLAPMEMGARYLVLLTSDLTDTDGEPIASPPVFEALRDRVMTSNPGIEEMRDRYDVLFETAATAGWDRHALTLAWELPIASEQQLLGPARSMRDQVMGLAETEGFPYTIDSVVVDPNENVAWLIKGHFTPPNFLDADNILMRDGNGGVVRQTDEPPSYPFTMTVPPVAREHGGLPLVLIGHGLFGDGEGMLDSGAARDLIQPFAAGMDAVLIATDWIGLSNGDLDLIITEVIPDMSRVQLVTDRLAQSHANQMALVELALSDLGADSAIDRDIDDVLLDPTNVSYYGISLGGIQGAGQVAISPRISKGVMAVPGAGWAHMIHRSTQFWQLEVVIDALYPDPLTQNVFVAMLQMFFDPSDPANLATLMNGDPSAPDAPAKTVILQEAIGDCQVPNIATDLLARTIGAAHLDESTDPVFGLETIQGPTTAPSLTQIRVPDDLDAYFPPDENTTPAVDNGVHNSAVLRELMYGQISHLMVTGDIIHPCDGPCDPN